MWLLSLQNRDQSDSDSEAEEEQLEELETMLKEHDPEFQRSVGGVWTVIKGLGQVCSLWSGA